MEGSLESPLLGKSGTFAYLFLANFFPLICIGFAAINQKAIESTKHHSISCRIEGCNAQLSTIQIFLFKVLDHMSIVVVEHHLVAQHSHETYVNQTKPALIAKLASGLVFSTQYLRKSSILYVILW